jgi:hypothetical protein
MLEPICFEMQDSQRNMKTSEKVQNTLDVKQQSVKQKHKAQSSAVQ